MIQKSLTILLVVLLSGCGLMERIRPAEETPESTPVPTPAVDPQAEKEARIYQSMHSEEIQKLTEQITEKPSAEAYGKRGDAYYAIAKAEDFYDAYVSARKDYEMVYFFGASLEDYKNNLAGCYQAEADKAAEEKNLDLQSDWLERMSILSPSKHTSQILLGIYQEIDKENANQENRHDYYDDEGNLDGYLITKYDENGKAFEMNTYNNDDELVDTFTGFEYDDNGLSVINGLCDMDLKFTVFQKYERDEYGIQRGLVVCDLKTGKELERTEIEYDELGRPSGFSLINLQSGKVSQTTEYLYDAESICTGADVYDGEGNLITHLDFTEEKQ